MKKGTYIPSTNELKLQYEKYKSYYGYQTMPDLSPNLELYIAKLWNDWIEAGNDPGDCLRTVILDGQPLNYWIDKYKELYCKKGE